MKHLSYWGRPIRPIAQLVIGTKSLAADFFLLSCYGNKPPTPNYKIMLTNGKKALVVKIQTNIIKAEVIDFIVLKTKGSRFESWCVL